MQLNIIIHYDKLKNKDKVDFIKIYFVFVLLIYCISIEMLPMN